MKSFTRNLCKVVTRRTYWQHHKRLCSCNPPSITESVEKPPIANAITEPVSLRWNDSIFKRMVFGLWHMGFYAENELIGHEELVRQMRLESEKVFANRKKNCKEIHPSDWRKAPQTLCFVKSIITQVAEQVNKQLPELEINSNQYVSKWFLGNSESDRMFKVMNGDELQDSRKLTIVYFMNPDYGTAQTGGEWEIVTEQTDDNGTVNAQSSVIEPLSDRILVFWSDTVLHKVLPGENVCYLSISLFTDNPKIVGKHINPEFNGFLTPLRSELKVTYFKNFVAHLPEKAAK